jgi:hypothetical protein
MMNMIHVHSIALHCTVLLAGAAVLGGCKPRSSAPASQDKPAAAPVPSVPDGPAGTTSGAKAAAPTGAGAGRYECLSNGGTYRVSYTPAPDPIPLNELFTLTAWVVPAEKAQPVTSPSVLSVDAAMPEHDHGMNTRPRVVAQQDGSYRVEGLLFHMPGRWELYFDVSSGGSTERAQVEVNLE